MALNEINMNRLNLFPFTFICIPISKVCVQCRFCRRNTSIRHAPKRFRQIRSFNESHVPTHCRDKNRRSLE